MWYSSIPLLAIVIVQVHSAQQFVTFKEGKVGVNFGGYHAGFGLGGLLGGGAGGGLFAEAGTPHGQSARAGLGGSVDAEGRTAGGLYAGATAGGNVRAEAGLAGKVAPEEAIGDGFASASAGAHHAVSGLAGETSVSGSSGITFSGTKSIDIPTTVVKETEVSVVPVELLKNKKIHTEFNVDALNEVSPVEGDVQADVSIHSQVNPNVIIKEVYVEPQPQIIEKHIIHTKSKPHHHFHNTAYVGGYIGTSADVDAQPAIVYKTVQPVVERREDAGSVNVGAGAAANVNGGVQTKFTKEVTVSRNPTLFQDIFNIPISALKAVSSFLSNTAGSTSVSVQKSATLQADSDSISPKHSSSSSSSSEGHISVQTPSASQLIDDIFAIPINTLGAVNKFLENNVPVRKRVRVTGDGSEEPTRTKLGPHARRRANKRGIIVDNSEH